MLLLSFMLMLTVEPLNADFNLDLVLDVVLEVILDVYVLVMGTITFNLVENEFCWLVVV